MLKLKSLIKDNNASAIPLILFFMTIIVCGALYTLFFLQVGQPYLEHLIPDSDAKTYIMMLIYSMPLMVLIVGAISLLQASLKNRFYYPGNGGEI